MSRATQKFLSDVRTKANRDGWYVHLLSKAWLVRLLDKFL